ncbi:MAG: hypothetical protein HFJ02_07135 [Bacilli bacterium]|nr:hypothetical protein [Bacilli bacterium]
MKKSSLLFIVVFLGIIGGCYYFMWQYKNSYLQKKENSSVSSPSILDKDEDLNLKDLEENQFNMRIYCLNFIDDTVCSEGVFLKIKEGHLYFTDERHEIPVTSSEKYITIYNTFNDCANISMTYLLLTEAGDLYAFKMDEFLKNSGVNIGEEAMNFEKLFEKTSIELPLVQLNHDEKIIGISKFREGYLHSTCGEGFPVVYSDKKEFLVVDLENKHLNKRFDGHIDEIGLMDSVGFWIYSDKSLSITGKEKLHNRNNDLFVYKKIFLFPYDEHLHSDFILIDEFDEVYVSSNETIVPYKTTKMLHYQLENGTLKLMLSNQEVIQIDEHVVLYEGKN